MEKKARVLFKLILTAVLSLLLIWLIYTDEKVLQKHLTQPEGEPIKAEDVLILTGEFCQALWDSGSGQITEDDFQDFREQYFTDSTIETGQLSYDTYLKFLDLIIGNTEGSGLKEKLTYKEKYEEDFFLLKEDWYYSYDQLLKYYGLEEVIRQDEITILCGNQNLVGTETIGDGCVLALGGRVYDYSSKDFADLVFTKVKAYARENRLLTLISFLPEKNTIPNGWIMEADNEGIQFFYEGYEIRADYDADPADFSHLREQIGDISFENGRLSDISLKKDRIGGKLLGISEDYIEIEGYGSIPFDEHYIGYQLYEELRTADASEMAIGYDFTDFVLDEGRVCAFLITRKESMETIRVAIKGENKSGGFGSLYHEKIVLSSQDDMVISYGPYDDRKQETIAAGEELSIEKGGKYLSGHRIEISPVTASGKIRVLSCKRNQGIPEYRGKMEIAETDEGLALINEVLLEEYLYSVVASEMPAHYPLEALKAQAVCARTYGYRYLEHPGYEAIGAHVDDSENYQVYNNKDENVNCTKAVKETAGVLLLYEEKPVSTYYYSTSCGFGADAGVWGADKKDEFPYLKSVYIARENTDKDSADALSQEEQFRDYISETDENAYEKEEAWFRWHYQADEIDASVMSQKIRDRYQAGSSRILTFTGDGSPDDPDASYEAREPAKFKKIYDIRCLKRKEGGVMDELLIETDDGIYKIITEYNIRYILNQGGEAVGQNDTVQSGALLPSAYLIIDTVKSGKNVVGYSIMGGGYGHGVGMSQNGARAMGLEGMDYGNILSFFYQDCKLSKIY